MAKISSSTIDEVNDRTDLVSLIGEYTRLERRGADWWARLTLFPIPTMRFSGP